MSKRTQHYYCEDTSSYQGWMNFLMAVCAVGIAMMLFLRLSIKAPVPWFRKFTHFL